MAIFMLPSMTVLAEYGSEGKQHKPDRNVSFEEPIDLNSRKKNNTSSLNEPVDFNKISSDKMYKVTPS